MNAGLERYDKGRPLEDTGSIPDGRGLGVGSAAAPVMGFGQRVALPVKDDRTNHGVWENTGPAATGQGNRPFHGGEFGCPSVHSVISLTLSLPMTALIVYWSSRLPIARMMWVASASSMPNVGSIATHRPTQTAGHAWYPNLPSSM